MADRPVGFFDSGLGGASVLREALKLLPNENYIYFGDNANAPYGDRTEDEITSLTFRSAHRLVDMGVKAIVLACNTATATCINQIRSEFSIPVISIEPAIKPACSLPGTGKVLMMATKATTRLERYLRLRESMPDPGRVINIPCPGIVERIEGGKLGADDFDDLFADYLAPYEGLEVDAIVLGCTHYIFIKDAFRRNAGLHLKGSCQLIDGNEGTVRQLGRVLEARNLANPGGSGHVTFCTSGNIDLIKPIFDMLISKNDL
ncbi:MAG: glutamate racemase [Clostridia bacterium]|nr:glutamate racemase [Clostridia bacterium]